MGGRRSACVLLKLAAILVSTSYSQTMASQEHAALLRDIAAAMRSNRERVRTWKGSAHVGQDISTQGNRGFEASVDFVTDVAKNLTRWNWKYEDQRFLKDGQTQRLPYSEFSNALLTGDSIHRVIGNTKPTTFIEMVISRVPAKRRFAVDDFDPMTLFDDPAGSLRPADERIEHLARQAEKTIDSNSPLFPNGAIQVSRQDDIVVLTVDFRSGGPDAPFTTEYRFDPRKAGSIVAYRMISPTAETNIVRNYAESADVWVLSSSSESRRRWSAGTDKSQPPAELMTKVLRITKTSINEPIVDAEFEWDKLGMKDGCWVTDRRTPNAPIRYQYSKGRRSSDASRPELTKTILDPDRGDRTSGGNSSHGKAGGTVPTP